MRRLLAALTATLAATAALLAFAQPAQAAVNLVYANTTGTTRLAASGLTVQIPTSVVRLAVDADTTQPTSPLTGTIEIPDFPVHLALDGVPSATAIVRIVPQSDLTGTVNWTAGTATITVPFVIRVIRLYPDAQPNVNLVGTGCTTAPTSATLTSDPPIVVNAPLAFHGVYTIPAFSGCGRLTPLLTGALSGGGNTLTLNLVP